jgi:L-seryl-tRNA(Ser) seleniumtransferase
VEPGEGDRGAELRKLPSVDRLVAALGDAHPHALTVAAARAAIAEARAKVAGGAPAPSETELLGTAMSLLEAGQRSLLMPVINATGVLIHTNLGRSPLGTSQLEAVVRVASSYSNLEYELDAGRRGSRYVHAERLLCAVTGAEAAVVVNNNAAAVLVALAALCAHKEVVISRGELIEIGGEFRIPDVIASSGARLVEVGSTNRTHIADYERAITTETAALLKVHPSNYAVVGFTAEVAARDLARLARGRKLYLIHDLGSGLISEPHGAAWLRTEPLVEASLEDGADLVTFSGDKLLGGPQAGIIAGRAELVAKVAKHPLMRAVRVDKMTLAALEATMSLYLSGRTAELPLWSLAETPVEELESRALAVVSAVAERVLARDRKSVV